MVMYNFHRSLAGLVASEWKNQTMRSYRKAPTIMRLIKWAPGDVIGSADDLRDAQEATKMFERLY